MTKIKVKVSKAFLREAPLKKTEIGEHVISEIDSHNPPFTNPSPKTIDLGNANSDLKKKIQDALNGDKEAIKERDASELVWNNLFNKEADYVDSVADGDEVIIAQSGFKSTKGERSKKEKPGQVIIKTVKGDYTTPGKIDIECNALPGADFYIAIAAQQTVDMKIKNSQALFSPQGQMGFSISSTRKLSVEDLQSGAKYFVMVIAFNTAGLGAESQAFTVIVP
jgi:hypothetical protein